MPGVPPNAVDNVKRLLKGIFRRGKNKKQTQNAEQSSTSQPVTNAPTQPPAGTTPAVDKPLPPTHPLTTGQHERPQEAVPQEHATQAGPKSSAHDVVNAENPGGATSAGPAAGVQGEDNPPAPPPKTDAAFDAPRLDTSENKETVVPTSNAPLSDSAIATPNTPAKPTAIATEATKPEPASNTPAVESQPNGPVEEKVPVMAEPAIPKANASAHGMSATSGPLEDFPEGMAGDKE